MWLDDMQFSQFIGLDLRNTLFEVQKYLQVVIQIEHFSIWVKRARMDIMQNSVIFHSTLELKYTN